MMQRGQEELATCLRPMRTEDIPRVMAVEGRVYPSPWTAGIFRDCLRVGYSAWVCEAQGQLIGYAVMSVAVGEAHILNLAVRPESQGRGVGRYLLRRLLELAREAGAERAYLEVRPSNERALQLYHTLGFAHVGRRKGYYPAAEGREDALLLARDL